MTSYQIFPCTVQENLIRITKKALFEERSLAGFLSMPHLKIYLSRYDWLVKELDPVSDLSISQIQTKYQAFSLWLFWPSNSSRVQCSHPVSLFLEELHSTVIKGVYKITTPDNAIGNFWWFFSDLVDRTNKNICHKKFIIIGNKYQWKQSSQNNTHCDKDRLPLFRSDHLKPMFATYH